MRNRLDRREVMVLLRLAAVVTLVLRLPQLLELWPAWESHVQRRQLVAAGMIPAGARGTTVRDMVWLAWPLAGGVVLYAGAGTLAKLVLRGVPGPGLCPACGYDLKGSPGGPCPECGARSAPEA